jgi:hypothetical protein
MTEIKLNDYQRDNLLWLLHLIRCGHTEQGLNSGDWVGEIEWMLAKNGFDPSIHKSNSSIEAFIKIKTQSTTTKQSGN